MWRRLYAVDALGMRGEKMTTAYDTAVEGKRLVDAGESNQAKGLLSGYVAENVEKVLDTVGDLMGGVKARVSA